VWPMERASSPIYLAGSVLSGVRHVCAFFESEDEEYRVLLPFIKDGFDCGEKAIHVVNSGQRDNHLQRLTSAGIDPAAAEESGQLEIRINTDIYLRNGHFDQDRMLRVFEQIADENTKSKFPSSRIVCRMDWVNGNRLNVENVIEFESRVNDVWRRHDDAVICTYHLSHFAGDTLIDIFRTHPMAIVGGVLFHNPFFTPPEEFRHELRSRRTGRGEPVAQA
jgi:hypothetical protein